MRSEAGKESNYKKTSPEGLPLQNELSKIKEMCECGISFIRFCV